jgi:hypothetical protein
VTELWNELTEKLGSLVGKWTSFTALGSFLVYLMGYLALRFQLSTYGIATNLDAWDERYLFAGSRFLVYLVSSVPNVLLIAIVLCVVIYALSRLMPITARERIQHGITAWTARPNALPSLGILLAVGLIQFVMRKSFALGSLLFSHELPRNEWIGAVLLADSGIRSAYFSGLVGGTLISGALLLLAMRPGIVSTPSSKTLVGLLAFLVAVEFLLLPVNYGILIASEDLPRVSEIGGDEKLAAGDQAWLLWQTKDATVFFVRTAADTRSVITVPRKDPKIKIVGYDAIFRMLFGSTRTGP